MSYLGVHILVDLYDCDRDLNDEKDIERLMITAALEARATVLHSYTHKFQPQGVSCVVVISESHLSIHTWPEFKQAQVDIFTCGSNALPQIAVECITRALRAKNTTIEKKWRGMLPDAVERIRNRQV